MKLNKLFLSSLCIAIPALAVSSHALAAKVTLKLAHNLDQSHVCLLYTSPSPRD